MRLSAAAVKRELKSFVNPEKAAFYPRFFKAGPGEYAAGDRFLGVVVPHQRKTARKFRGLPRAEIQKLLDDPYHECRLTGLFILIDQFEKTKIQADRKSIVDYYLSQTDAVNHWDLVDASAHKILGAWLVDQTNRGVLKRLSESSNLWEQRMAIVATYAFIRHGELDDTLKLAEAMLDHPHDLIHKATGWMLREVGKQQLSVLEQFLHQHASHMPRTMLRYAIEKMPLAQRQAFLQMRA